MNTKRQFKGVNLSVILPKKLNFPSPFFKVVVDIIIWTQIWCLDRKQKMERNFS